MRLSDVLYQPGAQAEIQRALRGGRVPHAFLFVGPDGVGKRMLAERLAAVLLCDNAAGADTRDACGRCTACTLLAADNHPDFHRIHRFLNKFHPDSKVQRRKAVDLSVDVIRHFVIGRIGNRPSQGRAKVFLVEEAERMNLAAQNALLKTLEEPPGDSYLILLAPSPDAMLPTTRSRCRRVDFRPIPSDAVEAHLREKCNAAPAAARFLAELAQGRLGTAARHHARGLHEHVPHAIELLRLAAADPLACGKGLHELAKEHASAIARQAKAAEPAIEEPPIDDKDEDEEDEPTERAATSAADTNTTREAQAAVFALVSTLLRDVQRLTLGLPAPATGDAPALRELAGRTNTRSLERGIRAVAVAEIQIDRNAYAPLMFDALGLALGQALSGAGGSFIELAATADA